MCCGSGSDSYIRVVLPRQPVLTNGAMHNLASSLYIFDCKRRDGDRAIGALKDADIRTLLLLFEAVVVIAEAPLK